MAKLPLAASKVKSRLMVFLVKAEGAFKKKSDARLETSLYAMNGN